MLLSRRDALKLTAAAANAAPLRALDRVLSSFRQELSESAKPWVYWYFMDGLLSLEGMKQDLLAMRDAGIGGAIFLEVGIGLPRGPVDFMSEEWQYIVTEAFGYADSLGIEIALAAGPGWCGTGGPWIQPADSMQFLVSSSTPVKGPQIFAGKLPKLEPLTPFFGVKTLPPDLRQEWQNFYVDEVVLAVPQAGVSWSIENLAEKAFYTRGSYSSQITGPYMQRPWVRSNLYPDTPRAESVSAGVDMRHVIDLTSHMQSDGTLAWEVPPGEWTLMRFGRTATGQTTRPAPLPLGFESDKLNPHALHKHLDAYIVPLLRRLGTRRHADRGLTTLHFDSWEMGSQNWSESFQKDFTRLRGYSPLPYLPVLAGVPVGSSNLSERFLWDLRNTVSELICKNHLAELREFARGNSIRLSIEPYDLDPGNDFSLGAEADIPMGEFWSTGYGPSTEYSVIEATSIGHTTGKRIIGAESFTAGREEHWHQHPASMKEQTDWAFCAGINRIVFHRFQAQSADPKAPGTTMGPNGGYGVHWDRTQTWWPMVEGYHQYITRCQALLRRGNFVADVLYLVPEGAPNVFVPPGSCFQPGPMQDRMGYNFDGCAAEALIARASVSDGKIVFPDGQSYRLLVLPALKTMTPQLAEKIASLVEGGAAVLGMPFEASPGLEGFPACDERVAAANRRAFAQHRPNVFVDETARVIRGEFPLEHAQWIAGNGEHARSFERSVPVSDVEHIDSAEIAVTASVSFSLSVNGIRAASGDSVQRVKRVDITNYLQPGENKIEILLKAGDRKKACIAAFTIRTKEGNRVLSTDASWSADGGAAVTLGPVSMAPWNLSAKNMQDVTLYPAYRITADLLSRLRVLPDFEGEDVRHIHHHDGDEDIFFISNRRAEWRQVVCRFRTTHRSAEWLDPVSAERRLLTVLTAKDGRAEITVDFAPSGSGFVIFKKTTLRPLPNTRKENTSGVELKGPWHITFESPAKTPGPLTFDTLMDWTDSEDADIRCFSGIATYSTRVHLDERPAREYILSLGSVFNIAQVRINGSDLGSVWCQPWRVKVPGSTLKQGENRVEIRVANLWINRLIADAALPEEQRSTFVTGGNPFKKDDALQPSGLLGPVMLAKSE